MKANKLITAAVTLTLLLPALSILAQGPPGNPPGGGSQGAPIDGGAIMLVVSAAAYGYKMMKERGSKEVSE